MEDLGGLAVVGAGRAAADVGLVRAIAGEGDQAVADEDRRGDHPVGQMVAAGNIGIVHQEDVAFGDVVAERRDQGAHGKAAAGGMRRQAFGLADDVAVAAGDEAGEVVRLAEDRAERRLLHHPSHLPADMVETVLRQREQDGIDVSLVHQVHLRSIT